MRRRVFSVAVVLMGAALSVVVLGHQLSDPDRFFGTLNNMAVGNGSVWSTAARHNNFQTAEQVVSSLSASHPNVEDNRLSLVLSLFTGPLHTQRFLPSPISGYAYSFERNGTAAILLTGLAETTIYNTLNSTARSRAAKVLSADIFPLLGRVARTLGADAPFKSCGVAITYGSRNFAARDPELDQRGETLVVFVPLDAASKYARGELSEDEFLKMADVYLADRDRIALAKVTLVLQ